jgi:co-chaperonin GroES (HSP10)
MEIRAFGERTLAKLVELPEKKKGILITPEAKKEYQVAQVIDSSELSEGMYVFTRKYAGLLMEYDGIEYVSFEAKEILAYSKELK